MSRRAQQATSWIALGAILIWSMGFCCCVTGTSCCSSTAEAEVAANDHHDDPCCSHEESSKPSSEPSSKNSGTSVCGCDSHTKSAVLVQAELPALVTEELAPLPEELPAFEAVSPPEKLLLSFLLSTPHQRGPPDATGLS